MRFDLFVSVQLLQLLTVLAITPAAFPNVGINCRGSALCSMATLWDSLPKGPLWQQRYALLDKHWLNATTFNTGENIICTSMSRLSGKGPRGIGSICAFGKHLAKPLTIGEIRDLVVALTDHGCQICGSVPVRYVTQHSNDPRWGELTFNVVKHPVCEGKCISQKEQLELPDTMFNHG